MENQPLRRAEESVQRLLDAYGKTHVRQQQLAAALAKSREELERVKGDVHRLQQQRSDMRQRLDSVIARLEALGLEEPEAPAENEESAAVGEPPTLALEPRAGSGASDHAEPKL